VYGFPKLPSTLHDWPPSVQHPLLPASSLSEAHPLVQAAVEGQRESKIVRSRRRKQARVQAVQVVASEHGRSWFSWDEGLRLAREVLVELEEAA
jgi:hypothetical protein